MTAFTLQSVLFDQLNALVLTYSDTVSMTASANTNPANFIITGGAQFLGNIVIFENTISFTIGATFIGRLYDIQTPNIVSSGNVTVDPTQARLSFYYGIGVITPVSTTSALGPAPLGPVFLISDPAMVGPGAPGI